MTVSCLKIDANRQGDSEMERNAQRHGPRDRVGLSRCRRRWRWRIRQLLLSEVSYDYTPTIGYTITGTLTLSDKMYMSPRITAPSYGGTACT